MKVKGIVRAGVACGLAATCAATELPAETVWPSVGTFYDNGVPLPSDELERILSENAAVLGFKAGASSFGSIVNCQGADTRIIEYDSPGSSLEEGSCRVEGSSLCVKSQNATDEECFEVRRLPGWRLLFFEIGSQIDEDLSDEEISQYRDQAVSALGLAPLDLEALAVAEGEIDIGPFSINLPEGLELALSDASGFPLGFSFGAMFSGIGLTVEQAGWPDFYSIPSRDHVSDETTLEQAVRALSAWEEGYRNRDLGGGWMGTEYRLDAYEAVEVPTSNGACMRIHEIISVANTTGGFTVRPATSWYTRQICISPAVGMMAMVSMAWHDPPEEVPVDAVKAEAEAILNTIQLGWREDRDAGARDLPGLKLGVLGRFHFKRMIEEKRFDQALALGTRLREESPQDPDLAREVAEVHFHLARAASAEDRVEEAIAHYSQAIDIRNGDYPAALNNRALLYAKKGRIDMALSDIDRAIGGDEGDSLYHANRCLFRRLNGQLERALEDCERAVALGPPGNRENRLWVYLQRGLVRRMLGNMDGAVADINLSLENARSRGIKRIQELMKAASLYDGAIDGELNPELQAALEICIRNDECFEQASKQMGDIVEFLD